MKDCLNCQNCNAVKLRNNQLIFCTLQNNIRYSYEYCYGWQDKQEIICLWKSCIKDIINHIADREVIKWTVKKPKPKEELVYVEVGDYVFTYNGLYPGKITIFKYYLFYGEIKTDYDLKPTSEELCSLADDFIAKINLYKTELIAKDTIDSLLKASNIRLRKNLYNEAKHADHKD